MSATNNHDESSISMTDILMASKANSDMRAVFEKLKKINHENLIRHKEFVVDLSTTISDDDKLAYYALCNYVVWLEDCVNKTIDIFDESIALREDELFKEE